MSVLGTEEKWFRDHQPWLLSCGYQLRPRLQPDWVTSWVTTPAPTLGELYRREDYARHGFWAITDAVRLSDGRTVMLKRIYSEESGFDSELIIGMFVSSREQMRDPDNHYVTIYQVLKVPDDDDQVIIVMPLLRKFDDPRFDTIGEGLDFIYQIFKGLRYLHRNHIAHRNSIPLYTSLDASELYPDGYHPVERDWNREFTGSAVQKYTRTQRPPKYYWIDFGFAVRFDASENNPLAYPLLGGDKSVPELQGMDPVRPMTNKPLNPFPTDVYYLGNLIKTHFTEGASYNIHKGRKLGYEFLEPLLRAMTQDDPTKRPNIEQCVVWLEELIRSQSSFSLRSQVWHSTDNPIGFLYRLIPHWFRRTVYILLHTPPIPSWGN